MHTYYVSTLANSDGEHLLHVYGCMHLPGFLNRHYVGDFSSCIKAIQRAKVDYPNVNGCAHCCNSCNKNTLPHGTESHRGAEQGF